MKTFKDCITGDKIFHIYLTFKQQKPSIECEVVTIEVSETNSNDSLLHFCPIPIKCAYKIEGINSKLLGIDDLEFIHGHNNFPFEIYTPSAEAGIIEYNRFLLDTVFPSQENLLTKIQLTKEGY